MKSLNTNEITLFIPTKNRPLFLYRLIKYYDKTNFRGTLIVLDASDGTDLESNKNLLSMDYSFNINHVIEQKRPIQAIFENLHLINTKYSTICNDDDLLITQSLAQSQEFLINNNNYSACWGTGIKVKTRSDNPFGIITQQKYLNHHFKYEDNLHFLNQVSQRGAYDVIFSLHYSQNYIKTMNFVQQFKSERFQALGMNLKVAITEKIKLLNNLYLIRQNHSKRDFTEERTHNIYWLSKENFSEELAKMIDLLTIDVHKTTNLSKNESKRVVENTFAYYFNKVFMKVEKNLKPDHKTAMENIKYYKNRFSSKYLRSKFKRSMLDEYFFKFLKK